MAEHTQTLYDQQVKRLSIVEDGKEPEAVKANKYYAECLKSPTHYFGKDKVAIVLVGCQMSGKTHFARKLQRTLARCVIQSRDFIRTSPQGVYTFDKAKEHKVHIKFYTQLQELYKNKSWKIFILDDANNTTREMIETLVFLESYDANIVPVVFEPPKRHIIEERLKEDKKGLKLEDIYKAADTLYDRHELLFSVYDPITVRQPEIDDEELKEKGMQFYNDKAAEEEKDIIYQIHRHILCTKPGETITSKLFQNRALCNFRFAMFAVYKELEDEKDKLFQQQIAPGPPSKKVRKVAKEEEKEEEKK